MIYRWVYSVVFLLGLLVIPLSGHHAHAQDARLQTVKDLESLGEQAKERELVILVMFSSDSCPFCEVMEESYLLPLLRNKAYKDKVLIRKIMVDNYETLLDFNGNRVEAEDFPRRYSAWVTPTLVFLNGDGEEVADKLVGVGTVGLFAGDIDNAIETATSRLQW